MSHAHHPESQPTGQTQSDPFATSLRQPAMNDSDSLVREDGWGMQGQRPKPPAKPKHPTVVRVGQAVNMPHVALVEWSVETPEGSDSGMFSINLTAPMLIRMSKASDQAMRLTVTSKHEAVVQIEATEAGANEMYAKLWGQLSAVRETFVHARNRQKRRLAQQNGTPVRDEGLPEPQLRPEPEPERPNQRQPRPAKHLDRGAPAPETKPRLPIVWVAALAGAMVVAVLAGALLAGALNAGGDRENAKMAENPQLSAPLIRPMDESDESSRSGEAANEPPEQSGGSEDLWVPQ